MGLAPPAAETGDSIVVVLSSQTSLVLRDSGERVLMPNDSLIMDGEFLNEVQQRGEEHELYHN